MIERTDQALQQLKMLGVRMTPQRHAILSYLQHAMTHPTADDIYKALGEKFPSMSVATVYNNLRMFIEAGLVREHSYGDSSSRFDADMTDHYHAICESCGSMVDFKHRSLIDVEHAAAVETGFAVRGHRMEIYGLCQSCASSHSNH